MKTFSYIVLVTLLISRTVAVAIVASDFSRYNIILERKPFGAVAVDTNPMVSPAPQAVAPEFVKSLRMCAISDSADFGLSVGIVDIKAKPPKSYFLHVGETQDGLVLLEADYVKEGALIEKDGSSFWIYLDGSSGNDIKSAHRSAMPRDSVSRTTRPSRQTINDKRKLKREEILDARRKKNAEHQDMNSLLTEEQRKTRQEWYQMDLIRAGGAKGPPLPIPLTKEMDDQLVSEGVLAPMTE